MPQHSAGLLVFDDTDGDLRVFLTHMGGPFWSGKDDGAWSIPKGLHDPTEEPAEVAARREFAEEVGAPPPPGPLIDLGESRQSSGKRVRAFAVRGGSDLVFVASNTFTIQWPPRSGRLREFPEMDRGQWFAAHEARIKMVAGQVPFLDALAAHLAMPGSQQE